MHDTWPFDAGAFGLDGSLLTGRTLLNLDTEDWGEIFIGCAGKNHTPGFCMVQALQGVLSVNVVPDRHLPLHRM